MCVFHISCFFIIFFSAVPYLDDGLILCFVFNIHIAISFAIKTVVVVVIIAAFAAGIIKPVTLLTQCGVVRCGAFMFQFIRFV